MLGFNPRGIPIIGPMISDSSEQDHADDEANKSRDWQKMMSDTSHQREVADLQKAGINPILSANAGASTPGGAMSNTLQRPQPTDSTAPLIGLFSILQKNREIEQGDRKLDQSAELLDLEKQKTGPGIDKDRSSSELNRSQARLNKKGLIRADLEGKAAGAVGDAISGKMETELRNEISNKLQDMKKQGLKATPNSKRITNPVKQPGSDAFEQMPGF